MRLTPKIAPPAAVAVILLLAATIVRAQEYVDNNPRANQILASFAQKCVDEDAGELIFSGEQALTDVALDSDGVLNDLVIDFNYIHCAQAMTLWSGTGGSPIHFVVDGTTSASWTAGYWELEMFRNMLPPIILLGRHGGVCDGYGAQPCVQAVAVDGGQFMTVRFPQSLEESGD